MTWHERLSHAVFGTPHQSLKQIQALPAGKGDLEATRAYTASSSSVLAQDQSSPDANSTQIEPDVASASPLPIGTSSISNETMQRQSASDGEESNLKRQVDSIPSSSSRRKNLAAILSSLKPPGSASSTERNAVNRPPLRSTRTNSLDAARESSTSTVASSNSDGSKSPSIGNSIKSLQERHRLHREAGETFKSMKKEEDHQDTSRLSGENLSRHQITEQSLPKEVSNLKLGSINIPDEILRGEAMLKVTTKKVMQRVLRLDFDRGQILWDSKKNNKINLEAIREVRTNKAASSYRSSTSISPSHEPRWISIIYQTEGVYKALHLIALSNESFQRWEKTLYTIQNERKMLMSGVDLLNQKQQVWLRQHWKAADSSENSRLEFEEVMKLCRRLGLLSNGRDLAKRFKEADSQGKGYLTFEDFQHFVTLLKRRIDVEILFLKWADKVKIEEDSAAAKMIKEDVDMEEVRELLPHLLSISFLSPIRLSEFISKEQKTHVPSVDVIEQIIKRYEEGSDGINMGYAGFLSFILSGDNAIMSDQSSLIRLNNSNHNHERESAETAEELVALSSQDRTRQDMTRPLSEYYISSSHNTYLVGGQWKGDSTVEGYIRALLQGARCVEIDCWDGPNGEPQVTHGRTLTSKVSFREVITAIERYAFIASPYPLILSLEVHNDLAQQDSLAEILQSILGVKLLSEPLESVNSDALPSPEKLKGKILVKAKNLLVVDAAINTEEETLPIVVAERRTNTSTTDTTESESGDHLLHSARDLVRSMTKRSKSTQRRSETELQSSKKVLMSSRLASLLIYTIGVKHRGINKKENYAVEHMISLSERSGLKYLKGESTSEDLIKHNRSHLTRVYPSMSSFKRLNQSANFIPNLFWSMGCQLVAINWQTLDLGNEMNQAMFARNAKSGYVLKPEALRVKDVARSGSSNTMIEKKKKVQVQITIRIISAQQLPRFRDACRDKEMENEDVIDPFVSLCIMVPQHRDYHVKSVKSMMKIKKLTSVQSLLSELKEKEEQQQKQDDDDISMVSQMNPSKGGNSWMSRQRTSVVKANGFNPIWNETMTFIVSLNLNSNLNSTIPNTMNYNADMTTRSIQELTRGLLDFCFLRFEIGEEIKSSLSISSNASSHLSLEGTSARLNPLEESNNDCVNYSEEDNDDYDNDKGQDLTTLNSLGGDSSNCLATYMISLGSLEQGYRHLPLYDAQLSQYLFSTLFVKTEMRIVNQGS